MTSLPLRLGRLDVAGFDVRRSGVRWLCEDGHLCRPGDIIGYCGIGLAPMGRAGAGPIPFAEEAQDIQVAFATRAGGRLRIAPDTSQGGFLDQLHSYQGWTPDFVIGLLERQAGGSGAQDAAGDLRLLMTAGRRMTDIAVERSGLMTGWYDRRRAWWGETDAKVGTLLSLGICEQVGIVRGELGAFHEFFQATAGPAQIIHISDEALVPCAAVLVDQLDRTQAQREEIAADAASSLLGGPVLPSAKDWLFMGALLSTLLSSPLTDAYDMLTRGGLRRSTGPDALLLSIHAESSVILRHRRLGYHVRSHPFRVAQAGPAVSAWFRSSFEPVHRTLDDIRRDCRALIDAVRARHDTQFLILNAMSSSGYEQVDNYGAFDRPVGDSVATVRLKELNLMLYDLARDRDVAIVDADLIGATLGARHLPDGMHQSGIMQAELRNEILHTLRARRVPGFAAPVT